ncbi:MAG: lipid-A-disaccharide synthase N-terminal domain-containing protein [Phycisphaerales bacterium]
MKPEPIIAMVLLLCLGLWLVLQPTLNRTRYDLDIRIGSIELLLERHYDYSSDRTMYTVVGPSDFEGEMFWAEDLDGFLEAQIAEWQERPRFARLLLGFFNVSAWSSFGWVAVGLLGQAAFFGRMLIQWIVSERSRVSTVPPFFWWLSLLGGVTLFTYFVWRKDVVGVLGQSTGIVIYARNLRLISKQRRHTGPTGENIA